MKLLKVGVIFFSLGVLGCPDNKNTIEGKHKDSKPKQESIKSSKTDFHESQTINKNNNKTPKKESTVINPEQHESPSLETLKDKTSCPEKKIYNTFIPPEITATKNIERPYLGPSFISPLHKLSDTDIQKKYSNEACKNAIVWFRSLNDITKNKKEAKNESIVKANQFINKKPDWLPNAFGNSIEELKKMKVAIVNAANSGCNGGGYIDGAIGDFASNNMSVSGWWQTKNKDNPPLWYGEKSLKNDGKGRLSIGEYATQQALNTSAFKDFVLFHAVGTSSTIQKNERVKYYKIHYNLFFGMLQRASQMGMKKILLCAVGLGSFDSSGMNTPVVLTAFFDAIKDFVDNHKDSTMQIILNNFNQKDAGADDSKEAIEKLEKVIKTNEYW